MTRNGELSDLLCDNVNRGLTLVILLLTFSNLQIQWDSEILSLAVNIKKKFNYQLEKKVLAQYNIIRLIQCFNVFIENKLL